MEGETNHQFLKPEEVQPATAEKVLSFLNNAKTAEEIAGAIRISDRTKVGLRIAQNIVARRTQVTEFRDLAQVATVARVGKKRFTEIVNSLAASK